MKQISRSTRYYANRLLENKPFTLARYGDGEWRTILGGEYIGQHNSNGCTFTPQLSKALRRVVKEQLDYDYGILRVAKRAHKTEIENWLQANRVETTWVDGDVILNDILSGNAFPLIEQLRSRRVLMVCPAHCTQFSRLGLFEPVSFVVPPPQNAYDSRRDVLGDVYESVNKFDIEVIAWSSGLASKYFIHHLFANYGEWIFQIDFGSAWDGFFGVGSRSYVRRGLVQWDALLEVNSGQRRKRKNETFRKVK